MNGLVRVILADDPDCKCEVASILSDAEGIELCGRASTVAEAIKIAKKQRPDVAVIGLRLSEEWDGLEAARRIGELRPKVQVAILGDDPDGRAFLESLAVGASGFLLKSASLASVVDAIHALASGQGHIDPSLHRAVLDHLNRAAGGLYRLRNHPRLVGLTEREKEIVMMLAQGKSNPQIAKETVTSIQTVKNHIYHSYRKLGVHTRMQFLALLDSLVWGDSPDRRPER